MILFFWFIASYNAELETNVREGRGATRNVSCTLSPKPLSLQTIIEYPSPGVPVSLLLLPHGYFSPSQGTPSTLWKTGGSFYFLSLCFSFCVIIHVPQKASLVTGRKGEGIAGRTSLCKFDTRVPLPEFRKRACGWHPHLDPALIPFQYWSAW